MLELEIVIGIIKMFFAGTKNIVLRSLSKKWHVQIHPHRIG